MPLELMKEIYESNEDFRNYVDKEYKLRSYDNPAITIDDILQFKIVQEVAKYYEEKRESEIHG
jgi:hypothetical protein